MKKLFLLRHAKSDWENNLEDIERPLGARGYRELKILSGMLSSLEITPNIILCSSSVRTRETLDFLLKKEYFKKCPIEYKQEIYDFHESENLDYYLSLLEETFKKYDNVLLVGHDPFLSSLLAQLSENTLEMGTTSFACLECENTDDIKNTPWELNFYVKPKKFLEKKG